jgi:pimeloyl-ACP methyl ester carboxylesterase
MKTGHAPINGLNLYYEIHGSGDPVILLHGGLGSTEMVAGVTSALSKNYQVIAADLQAHGRTADINRPITYEAMGDDIAALMEFLHLDKGAVIGYSLGAGTALQLTIRHPALIRKLVVVSTVFKRNGWFPEILTAMDQMGPQMAEMMKPSPIYQTYARIAPKPENWPSLISKVSDLLRKDYDWSKEVAAITAPVMLVFGDADSIRPQHIVEFFALLGGGLKDAGWDGSGFSKARLAILPGESHYSMFDSPALVPAVMPFLDELPRPTK